MFVQAVVNLGWIDNWMKGDISTAFLQGTKRDTEKLGQLYLQPPKKMIGKLKGVEPGALFELRKSVYGLPDAPRAWWNELTKYLVDELHFVHSRLDCAFLVWYHEDGSVGVILIVGR